MRQWLRTQGGWWLAWLLVTGAGAVWIARAELRQLHEDFEANGRIAHRLMSQQVVQYDAVLATLALLEPAPDADPPEQRLPSVYPSILGVQRRDARRGLGRSRAGRGRGEVARAAAPRARDAGLRDAAATGS